MKKIWENFIYIFYDISFFKVYRFFKFLIKKKASKCGGLIAAADKALAMWPWNLAS